MTRRTTEAYVAALKYVHENLIELNGKGIITDFECSMRASLEKVVPLLKVYGCWFHHCQALRRILASIKSLFELVRTNDAAKTIFRQFQCLALLPAEKIEHAFVWLLREALTVNKFAEFAPFIEYYKKQWLRRVKPINYSVFMQDIRTTAAAEAFNGKCNRTFKTHGNFFSFITVLQKEEAVSSDDFERDIKETVQ